MSIARQQRQSFNRRTVTAATPQLTPQLATILVGFTAHTVSIGLRQLAQPPTLGFPVATGQGSGVLQLLRAATGTYPSATAWDVDQNVVTLTYTGADIAPGEAFLLGPYDPAVRDAYGGYLGPALYTTPIAPPAPATAMYTARAASGTAIAVAIAPGLPVAFDPMMLSNHDDMTDQLPTGYSFDGTAYTLTYVGPVNVHDTLTYTGPALTGDGDVWRNLDRASVDVSS